MKHLVILSLLVLSLAALVVVVAWRVAHPDIEKIPEEAKRLSDELLRETRPFVPTALIDPNQSFVDARMMTKD